MSNIVSYPPFEIYNYIKTYVGDCINKKDLPKRYLIDHNNVCSIDITDRSFDNNNYSWMREFLRWSRK